MTESRSSDRKLKPLPPDLARHQDSAIAPKLLLIDALLRRPGQVWQVLGDKQAAAIRGWPRARLWPSRHTLRQSQCVERISFSGHKNGPKDDYALVMLTGASIGGSAMPKSTLVRFATFALFAWAAVSLTTAAARAFSQENLNINGVGNSRFADPDSQGSNLGRGAQPFGPNGPSVQFGAHQGGLTPFGRSQGSGSNAPPPDYSKPLGN